jgi:hypothetical protein
MVPLHSDAVSHGTRVGAGSVATNSPITSEYLNTASRSPSGSTSDTRNSSARVVSVGVTVLTAVQVSGSIWRRAPTALVHNERVAGSHASPSTDTQSRQEPISRPSSGWSGPVSVRYQRLGPPSGELSMTKKRSRSASYASPVGIASSANPVGMTVVTWEVSGSRHTISATSLGVVHSQPREGTYARSRGRRRSAGNP